MTQKSLIGTDTKMIDLIRIICILVVLAATWKDSGAVGPSTSPVRNPYTELFEQEEPLEDWKLMQIFLKMGDTRFQDVGDTYYDSVKYWYDAMVNFRPDHCTRAHWDELGNQFYQQTQERNGGLLLIARKALIDFCSGYYNDLDRILDRLVGDSLTKIKDIYNKFEYWYRYGEPEDWHFVWLARKVAGVGIQSKEKFDQAWENGFCAKILHKLQEPDVAGYARFTNLVTQAGPYYFKYCNEPVRFWIKIVNMCLHLQNAEKKYVNKKGSNVESQVALASVLQTHSLV